MFTFSRAITSSSGKIAFGMMLACGVATTALAQAAPPAPAPIKAKAVDPGVRGGAAGAGGPLLNLAGDDLAFFNIAALRFNETDSVSGGLDVVPPAVSGAGLGPTFNGNNCAECHAQPAIGGTSPALNPQIATATLDGAKNTIPPFITANGPTREARFRTNPDGTPDGGVHDLFVITGRVDAGSCNAVQPNFPQAIANNNISFRIPTPLFGLGLVENTPDSNLIADAAAANPTAFGVSLGVFNRSGNDGTIMRFGWKAQNKSIMIFAGEAYNVEQGVTNDLFPNERTDTPSCILNGLPEDIANVSPNTQTGLTFPASQFSSDVVNFTNFIRLAGAPIPAPPTSTTTTGLAVFNSIGCATCHVAKHVTSNSAYGGQDFVTYFPYSDFALHDMGAALNDHISQGAAIGNQFRTSPLWGIGQRIFFLSDGRTSDLAAAIEDHSGTNSEANTVINNFNALTLTQQQCLLAFLRSL
ncbi:MAG: hypothetical protein QOJ54_485 [Aliidongia sp.]|jgi:CxxC motif-containing protein (DUF1111 family)|nr:hypothetical protein [Aliidongia sp.]